jgi:hypothetical protein|tara:strand:+ start:86 stop:526 length:441 start_codon:yes stop_codon:yes gene_type:complete
MGQHNSFSKDIDLLAEAYGAIGAAHTFQDFGNAQQAANQMRDEDGEDKTGHLSDHELLDKVEKMGTAGDRLIDAAKKRLDGGESLTDHERDALARDAYGQAERDIAGEDNEDTDEADAGPEKERRKTEDAAAARQGFSGQPATPAH